MLKLQTDSCPHHRVAAKVDVRIIVRLPKPSGSIVVYSDPKAVNVVAVIRATRFE